MLDARCAGLSPAALEASFQTLETEAHAWLEREGLAVTAHRFERSADMRYVGQSFELTAPLPDRIDGSLDPVLEAFYRVYHDVYGYVDREAPVEIVDLRMQVVGVTPKPASLDAPPAAGPRAAAHGGRAPDLLERDRWWRRRSTSAPRSRPGIG